MTLKSPSYMQETTLNFEEALKIADEAVFAKTKKHVTDIEMIIFRGAWHDRTYEEIAENTEYAPNYLHRMVGHKFWERLSDALGEKVSKKNFKTALERRWRETRNAAKSDSIAPAKTASAIAEFPEEPVTSDSFLYVDRPPIEERCYKEITQPGALIWIKAPERMGKTLLSTRILERAEKLAYRKVYLDLNLAEPEDFRNLHNFLQWFCVSVTTELDLPNQLNDYWDEEFGNSKMECTSYFQKYILARQKTPLALCLDEIDRVFPYREVAEGFFSMLRAWHEKGKISDAWKRLRLILVQSTEVNIDMDINESPFQVATPIDLPEFNQQQVYSLARHRGLDWTDAQIKQLMAVVGGHPELVDRACSYLASYRDIAFEQFLEIAPTEAGIYGNHLRRLWRRLEKHSELLEALKKIMTESIPVRLELTLANKLHSMGLVRMLGNDCRLRCNLYRRYFGDRLGIR